MSSRTASSLLRAWNYPRRALPYVPLAVIVLYAFNRSNLQTWPISTSRLRWFSVACHDRRCATRSCSRSCRRRATCVALVAPAALRGGAYRFFGVNAVSFLVVIPIALPGCDHRLARRRRRGRGVRSRL